MPKRTRQTSLFAHYNTGVGLSPNTPCVDLCCGIGGFSEGARSAGHRVVLAVDCDEDLLRTHAANHSGCRHICATLPCDDLPLPIDGAWHLHCSPPCTKLSIMQPLQDAAERRDAVDLVLWYFALVLRERPTSWSFEQVNYVAIRDKLAELKRTHPMLVDWDVVDAVDYGVPQNRRRIIAGSPFLIDNLRHARGGRHGARCVRDVIPNPPRPFIRNNLYSRPDRRTGESMAVPFRDQMRSVDEPSYTILATGHKRWADADGNVLRHLTGKEGALLQSFPPDYTLPARPFACLVGVGNALPPLLTRALMRPTRPRVSL